MLAPELIWRFSCNRLVAKLQLSCLQRQTPLTSRPLFLYAHAQTYACGNTLGGLLLECCTRRTSSSLSDGADRFFPYTFQLLKRGGVQRKTHVLACKRMRFLWQSQHIEYHAAYTKTNFPRVLHFSAFILCCMHAYTVRHCNCAEGLHFSAFIT